MNPEGAKLLLKQAAKSTQEIAAKVGARLDATLKATEYQVPITPSEERVAAAPPLRAEEAPSPSVVAEVTPAEPFSWTVIMITLVIGVLVATLTLMSERKPQTCEEGIENSSSALARPATPPAAASTAPAQDVPLPLPPSALPPPPSAPMGATMLMDASYVAVGQQESNSEPPEADFEFVGKPKWFERPFTR